MSTSSLGQIFFRLNNKKKQKNSELSLITIKKECPTRIKRKDGRIAGCDNANQSEMTAGRVYTELKHFTGNRKVPVGSLANYAFMGLLNILSEYKQMKITPSPSVLLSQLFNF